MIGRRGQGGLWMLLVAWLSVQGVLAGFLDVEMEPAYQCGYSTVTWSGDDGPYHLLLTPTDHIAHGYNVWVPTIPNGTYSYNLTINQPAGMQFVLTMWGASGVTRAGTTDVMTVRPPGNPNATCFLTDEEILGLYTFSFNITDTSGGYPPQCSNLSMTWPTSLESVVEGAANATAQQVISVGNGTASLADRDDEYEDYDERDVSSSDHAGNTTYPPTMFGVIPLGNAFSIPITYDRNSKYGRYLPESSRSDHPTTMTKQGVTYLEWEIELARGTRFILVAGIGSDQQWASGGSSRMLTVGQGGQACVGSATDPSGDGVPSVTASPKSSTKNYTIKVVLACVLSVLGTLLVVGILFFCCRLRRRRKESPSKTGSLKVLTREGASKYNSQDSDGFGYADMPLDLIASRDGGHVQSPILTNTRGLPMDSPSTMTPTDGESNHALLNRAPPGGSTRDPDGGTYTTDLSSRDNYPPYRNVMNRQQSTDPLLRSGTMSPVGTGTYPTVSTHRPLTLHDRTMGLPQENDEEDVPDLKRETLAYLGDGPSSSNQQDQAQAGRAPAPRRRRRPESGEEMEYVVHRDAGRIRNNEQNARQPRVLELPPRYEELNWDGEPREGEDAEEHAHDTHQSSGSNPSIGSASVHESTGMIQEAQREEARMTR